LVDVPGAAAVNRFTFLQNVERWLQSDWLSRRQYLRLDFGAAATITPLPAAPEAASAGVIIREELYKENHSVEVNALRDCHLLFRVTWHPNWHVYVDGRRQPTMMLTPGFLGVPIGAGRHHVDCRYEPGPEKLVLAGAGWMTVLAAAVISRLRSRRAGWRHRLRKS
jgi:hypothetical protein